MKKNIFGFTVIELLVSISLILIAVVGGTGILLSSLKNKKKVENLTLIKQSGSHAIDIITTKVRNAEDITACILDENNTTDTIVINNYSDSPTDTTTYVCNDGIGANFITEDGNILVADYVTACNFDCNLSDSQPDFVKIAFTLSIDSGLIYGAVSQIYQQSIYLRNY